LFTYITILRKGEIMPEKKKNKKEIVDNGQAPKTEQGKSKENDHVYDAVSKYIDQMASQRRKNKDKKKKNEAASVNAVNENGKNGGKAQNQKSENAPKNDSKKQNKNGNKKKNQNDNKQNEVKISAEIVQAQETKKQGKNKKNKKNNEDNGKKLRVIPLGGLGEVGKNMTLFEYGDDMVIIDCGVGFPDEDMFGIDLVIPDFSYIEANRAKLRGVLLTHGQEDHIGAIPYFLRTFNVPVYGTALAIGIIKNKLKEHRLSYTPRLETVKAGDKVRLGVFEAEFIHVNHSIPDACAIALSTPVGVVIHSGDFKLDVSPMDGTMMDIARFGELGNKGVKLLMCESTNAERNGFTPSERSVGGVLENVFISHRDKRIVVATFSSNVHRVMQVIDVSVKYGRKVAITGRSMEAVVAAATELGYMNPPENTVISVADMKNYAPGQVTLVTTGSQGEPMSSLYRMAFSDRSQVTLGQNDVVVLSSSIIPGNEKLIGKIINEFAHNGIETIHDSVYSGVHASGHACSEEIKLLIQLCKPEFYMPVHGEFRHLNANRNIAQYIGISPDHVISAEIGNVVEVGKKTAQINGTVPSGRTLIDGFGIGDVGNAVLRDRKHLSEDGMLIVFATVDINSRLIINPPEIVSKGFVYVPDSEELLNEAKNAAADELYDAIMEKRRPNLDTIKERVGSAVLKVLSKQTGRKPMVIPFITDL